MSGKREVLGPEGAEGYEADETGGDVFLPSGFRIGCRCNQLMHSVKNSVCLLSTFTRRNWQGALYRFLGILDGFGTAENTVEVKISGEIPR